MNIQTMPRTTTIQETPAHLVELLAPYAVEVEYPESDGEPMAETDTHRDQMTDALLHPLKERLRGEAYVTGNILFYYEEGNPHASVAPDVFVVFDLPDYPRRTYKLWEEGKVPDIVFELTSKSTRSKDLNEKRWLYESLGIREYFLFDPLNEYLDPPLQGFRLLMEYYVPLKPDPLPDGGWAMFSEVLGLQIETSPEGLHFWDPADKKYLLTRPEEAEARHQAESRAIRESEARHQAESRATREAEARHQAESRSIRELEARYQAETRAAEAETEVTRLRAILEKSRSMEE